MTCPFMKTSTRPSARPENMRCARPRTAVAPSLGSLPAIAFAIVDSVSRLEIVPLDVPIRKRRSPDFPNADST